MAKNSFATHHAAAKKAHDAGDHSKAMHHIGHMMMAVRGAAKGTTGAPGPAAPIAPDMDADDQPTSAPVASTHFFGQVASPKPKQVGAASRPVPSGGFNKSRFAGMKGR